ncbi:MAG: cell division protein FtsZ [Patescibacteria group bacterium]|nr:cell division protein FtsZ [Patescibacteria group bacterium]
MKGKLKKAKKTGLNPEEPKSKREIIKKIKIRVIGIGGGAGNIVSEIASKIKKVSFVVANTDLQALKTLKGVDRFQFGQSLTQGLGTGMSAELGREAAQKEKERIKKLLTGFDLCILIACLGGGTGSGAAPIFAKIAKNLNLLTYGIFTLPFKFEGEKKAEIAKISLQKLKPNLNAISILPNERIFQIIDRNTPLKEALSAINKRLAESLGGLIETIYLPGLINIDFADLKTILQGQGRLAFLNRTEVRGEEKNLESIKKVLNCPLYPYGIEGAKGLLFNIAGEKELSLAEVSQISKSITGLASQEAKIIFGISQNKKNRNKIKVTLLAVGCGTRGSGPKKKLIQKSKSKSKKGKVFKNSKEKKTSQPKVEVQKESNLPAKEPEINQPPSQTSLLQEKIRKNALQIKREIEEEEKELLKEEEKWDIPAFLRRNNKDD